MELLSNTLARFVNALLMPVVTYIGDNLLAVVAIALLAAVIAAAVVVLTTRYRGTHHADTKREV